jgi:hypothetical protein
VLASHSSSCVTIDRIIITPIVCVEVLHTISSHFLHALQLALRKACETRLAISTEKDCGRKGREGERENPGFPGVATYFGLGWDPTGRNNMCMCTY